MDDARKAQGLIEHLFHDRLIADVEILHNPIQRTYLEGQKINWAGGDVKLIGLTTDERIPAMMAAVKKYYESKSIYPVHDLIYYSIATGSRDYINWIKE